MRMTRRGQEGPGTEEEDWVQFYLPDPECCQEIWAVKMSTGFSWDETALEEECDGELDDVLIHFAEHNYPYPRQPCPFDLGKGRGQEDKQKSLKRSGVMAPAAGEIEPDEPPVIKKKKTCKVSERNTEDCEGISGLSSKDDKVKRGSRGVGKTEEIHPVDALKLEAVQEESSLAVYVAPKNLDTPEDKLETGVDVKMEVYSGNEEDKTDGLANTEVILYDKDVGRRGLSWGSNKVDDKGENWGIRIKAEEDLQAEDVLNSSMSTTNLEEFLAEVRERDFEDISPTSAMVLTFGDLDKLKISSEECYTACRKQFIALNEVHKPEYPEEKKDNRADMLPVSCIKVETLNKSRNEEHEQENSAAKEVCSSADGLDKPVTPSRKVSLTSTTLDKPHTPTSSSISDDFKTLTVKGRPPANSLDVFLIPDKPNRAMPPFLKIIPHVLNISPRTAPDLDDKVSLDDKPPRKASEIHLKRLEDKVKSTQKSASPSRKIQRLLAVAITTLSQTSNSDNPDVVAVTDKLKDDKPTTPTAEGADGRKTETQVDQNLYEEHSLHGFIFERRRRKSPSYEAVTPTDPPSIYTVNKSGEPPEVNGNDPLRPDCCFCNKKQNSVQDLKIHTEICPMKTLYYKLKPYFRHKTARKGGSGGRALCKVCNTDFKVLKLYKLLKHVSKCFYKERED